MLKKILSSFEYKQKRIFIFTIFLTFVSTLTEVISLGSLVPLIIVLINPDKVILIEYLNVDYIKNLNLKFFFLSIFLGAVIFSIEESF